MKKQRVWVGMEAVDKKVGGPPCKGCKDRYSACWAECKRYTAWKDRRNQERKAYYQENGGDLELDLYAMQSYQNIQRKKGEKVKER